MQGCPKFTNSYRTPVICLLLLVELSIGSSMIESILSAHGDFDVSGCMYHASCATRQSTPVAPQAAAAIPAMPRSFSPTNIDKISSVTRQSEDSKIRPRRDTPSSDKNASHIFGPSKSRQRLRNITSGAGQFLQSRYQTASLSQESGPMQRATTESSMNSTVVSTAQEKLPCRCDAMCSLFDDCCEDGYDLAKGGDAYIPADTDDPHLPPSVSPEMIGCHLLHPDATEFPDETVYMVDRCPADAPSSLANTCNKEVPENKYKYLMDMPVVSRVTNTIYANVFCAKCHNDNKLIHLKHNIFCSCDLESKARLRTMNYLQGELMWTGPLTGDEQCSFGINQLNCKLSSEYPKTIGRHCQRELIDKCADGWPNIDDEYKCVYYNYYIQDTLGNVYKNPFCARCNNVPMDRMECLTTQKKTITRFGGESPNLFLLSDLFATNTDCSDDEALDIISDECLSLHQQHSGSTGLSIFFIVLMSFSLLAMALHIVIFLLLFKQRNLHTKNLFAMTCSLFWAELLLLICSVECHNVIGCYISTIIVYYLFMSAFFWMNVMSYDICKTFRSTKLRSNSHRMFLKYALYAFGCPAVLAVISIIVDQVAPDGGVNPGFGDNGFWFSTKGGLLLFFIGPTELIFIANIAMLGVTMYDIFVHQKQSRFATKSKKSRKHDNKSKKERDTFLKESNNYGSSDEGSSQPTKLNQIRDKIKEGFDRVGMDKARLILYTKLALIMGVPWIFAAFDDMSAVCQVLFNVLNSLQGLFIFLAFDCKRKVCSSLCKRFGWISMAQTFTSSTGVTQESSMSNSESRSRIKKSGNSGIVSDQP